MEGSLQLFKPLSPNQGLESYLSNVVSIPLLEISQEKEIAERFYYENDLDAARQLVMSHLRFVVHIARSYAGYGISQADLIQEGNVGLMKAVKRFNPEKGVRLVSFAVHWIKAEIHEFILKNWRIVKVATTKAQRKLFFNLRSNKKRLTWFTKQEAERVAADLGVDVNSVYEMESRLSNQDAAFDGHQDASTQGQDTQELNVSPAQYLADETSDPATLLENMEWKNFSVKKLRAALFELDERSRDILCSRWLNDDSKQTLHDLAKKHKVSAERIRQLELGAFKSLKGYLTQELVDAKNGRLLLAEE